MGKPGRGRLRAGSRIKQTQFSTSTRTYRHVSPDGAAPRSRAMSAKRAWGNDPFMSIRWSRRRRSRTSSHTNGGIAT
jgi:hypothetical protein